MGRTKKRDHGGAREGAGRPPKPPSLKQRQAVMVKLTDAERAELEQAAAGEPLGTYLRRLVLIHLSRRRRRPR